MSPRDTNLEEDAGSMVEANSEDGFVPEDDDSSSLPPDYWDNHHGKGADKNRCQPKKVPMHDSGPGTAPTSSMTASMADSNASFSFEITLPPPAEVSPLSCKESVVTAMMARPLDRALEHLIPGAPMEEESPLPPQRHAHQHRAHGHSDSEGSKAHDDDDDDDDNNNNKRRRSCSTHALKRKLSHHSAAESSTSSADQRSRHRSKSEAPTRRRSKSRDATTTRSKSRDVSSDERRRRHRSRSRATPGDRDLRQSRHNLLAIPAIKEETEEGLDNSQEIAAVPSKGDGTPQHPERRRSRSRNRSPIPEERPRSRSKSRHREPSMRPRQRSPSSSQHQRTRSKSRKRSPSKSRHGESSRSSSRKLEIRERSKSPSKSRHREPSMRPRQRSPSSSRHQRTRSKSRKRSPSKSEHGESSHSSSRKPEIRERSKSPSKSRHREPSMRPRQRSPSSSRHQRTRSKSRKRSPSKSRHGESSHSSSRKLEIPERSKSKARSRSRSNSRPREMTTEDEAKQYLATLTRKNSCPAAPQKSSMKPSFLSRLAESREKSSDRAENGANQKSIKWGVTKTEVVSPQKSPMTKDDAILFVVEEEIGDVRAEPLKEMSSEKNDERKQRTRSQSRSRRRRSQSRKRRESKEEHLSEKKEKKKTWEELLNASKNSFDFSADSFYFDPNEDTKAPSPMKSITPNLNPVVLRSDISSPLSRPNGMPHYEKIMFNASPLSSNHVTEMIKEKRQRAEESRQRQASISEVKDGCYQKYSSNLATSSFSPESSNAKRVDSMDSKERIKNASALIVEKRKRRAASRARQTKLELHSPSPDQMDESRSFVKDFSPSQLDIVHSAAQFSPALRVSNKEWTHKQALESFKNAVTNNEVSFTLDAQNAVSSEIGRDDLRNGMGELEIRPRPSLVQPSPREVPLPELTHKTEEDSQKQSRARARRKERSEARRAAGVEKMGSANKWKQLSVKVDAMKNPSSFRHGELPDSLLVEESSSKPRSVGRSKWAGLKGGMDFIARMKKA